MENQHGLLQVVKLIIMEKDDKKCSYNWRKHK